MARTLRHSFSSPANRRPSMDKDSDELKRYVSTPSFGSIAGIVRSKQLAARVCVALRKKIREDTTEMEKVALPNAVEDQVKEEESDRDNADVFEDELKYAGAHLAFGEFLGEGTSGKCYAVKGPSFDGQDYAVKVVDVEAEMKEMRKLEARIHAELGGHESIVRYHVAWFSPNAERMYVLMERCHCELWDAVIEDPEMDESIRIRWSQQICNALAHIHRHNYIHRDLSPWNVFTKPGPDGLDVQIGDFGLSVRAGSYEGYDVPDGSEGMPLDESAVGSLFSAPELGNAYGLAVDLFSLGQTLFFIWDFPRDVDDFITRVEGIKHGEDFPNTVFHEEVRVPIRNLVSHDPIARPSATKVLRLLKRWEEDREESSALTVDQTEIDIGRSSSTNSAHVENEVHVVVQRIEKQQLNTQRELEYLKEVVQNDSGRHLSPDMLARSVSWAKRASMAVTDMLATSENLREELLNKRCYGSKTGSRRSVHFVRHGQSSFNVEYEKTKKDPYMFDSDLTEEGCAQAQKIREHLASLNVDLVVTSPLLRACRTASLAMEGSSAKWNIWPEVREALEASCDLGSSREVLEENFPDLPWEEFYSRSDVVWWYHADDHALETGREVESSREAFTKFGFIEPRTSVKERGDVFLEKIRSSSATSVAVFSHADILHDILERHFSQSVWLDNCEIFTVVV